MSRTVEADLLDTSVIPRLFAEAEQAFGRAGGLMIAEFARRHIERQAGWGRIIGLTSGGPLGFPGELSYGAAKAALENYTMAAAVELGRLGVTANMVYPPCSAVHIR